MKKAVILLIILLLTVLPVRAMDITAPPAPGHIEKYIPEETGSFMDGVWRILRDAIFTLDPQLKEAVSVCVAIIAAVMVSSYISAMSEKTHQITNLITTLVICGLLLRSTDSFIKLGIQTVNEIIAYGKLLLPVMTTGLAAQGAASTSTALFTITSVFLNILSVIAARIMIPFLYIYIALFVCGCVTNTPAIANLQKLMKWGMTWTLKLVTYAFTGFLGITKALSGTVDASAIKAAKLALSGMIPVVGNVISDASESVLLSAGILKNTAGVYGMLVVLSLLVNPFFQIGVHYAVLKLTGGICGLFGSKETVALLQNFAAAMGYILALLGTVSILLLLSTVCFMKGIS